MSDSDIFELDEEIRNELLRDMVKEIDNKTKPKRKSSPKTNQKRKSSASKEVEVQDIKESKESKESSDSSVLPIANLPKGTRPVPAVRVAPKTKNTEAKSVEPLPPFVPRGLRANPGVRVAPILSDKPASIFGDPDDESGFSIDDAVEELLSAESEVQSVNQKDNVKSPVQKLPRRVVRAIDTNTTAVGTPHVSITSSDVGDTSSGVPVARRVASATVPVLPLIPVVRPPVTETHPALRNLPFQVKLNYKFEPTSKSDPIHTSSLRGLLPPMVNLRTKMPAVLDQGNLGSCVSNAIANALRFCLVKNKKLAFTPSRLFIYYNGRVIEGTVKEDSGLYCRDGCKSVAIYGTCDEKKWPYIISQFKTKPTAPCFLEAKSHTLRSYFKVQHNATALKTALAEGFPIVCGVLVYESFLSNKVSKTGVIPQPNTRTEDLLGGHCILIIGYDDRNQIFYGQNSWGTGWGDKGFFTIPASYILNPSLASDFWTIRDFK